jgi:hypothetical protein
MVRCSQATTVVVLLSCLVDASLTTRVVTCPLLVSSHARSGLFLESPKSSSSLHPSPCLTPPSLHPRSTLALTLASPCPALPCFHPSRIFSCFWSYQPQGQTTEYRIQNTTATASHAWKSWKRVSCQHRRTDRHRRVAERGHASVVAPSRSAAETSFALRVAVLI